MTEHTKTRPLLLAAAALTLFAAPAMAEPPPLPVAFATTAPDVTTPPPAATDSPSPLPWTGQGEHLVCALSVSPLDRDLDVASWERPQDTSVLAVKRPGWYWLFDGAPVNDGTLQENETAWLRVSNPANPSGQSAQQNCEQEWVVADVDEPGERRYLGLFWLDKGPNAVTMHHACPLIRMGRCGTFQNGRPGSSCVSYSANTVHLGADSLCAVQAPVAR